VSLAQAVYDYATELEHDSRDDALILRSQVAEALRFLVREYGDTEPPPAPGVTTPAPPPEDS
jgi:hypothetical protein